MTAGEAAFLAADVVIAVFDASSRLSFEGIERALGVLKGMEMGCAFWVVADTFFETYGADTGLGDGWGDIGIPSVPAGIEDGRALAERFGCGFSVICSERDEDVDGVEFDVIVGYMDRHPEVGGARKQKPEAEKGSRARRFFSLFHKSKIALSC